MITSNQISRILRELSLAVAVSLLASCSQKEEEYLPEAPGKDAIEMSLTAGLQTRTMNDGDRTLWTDGDALSVIYSAEGSDTFSSSKFDWVGDNFFTGTASGLSPVNDWYALYPYDLVNTSASEVHLFFESQQTQIGNSNKSHFAGSTFPLFGRTPGVPEDQDLSIPMRNVLAGVQFNFTNLTGRDIVVKKIEFTSSSYIAGYFTMDLTAEDPVPIPLNDETNSTVVTLTVEDGEAISPDEKTTFFAAVAPHSIPEGGSIYVKATAIDITGEELVYEHTYTLASGTVFSSGVIKQIAVKFDGLVNRGTFNLENEAVRNYLVAADGIYTDDISATTIVTNYSSGSSYSSITRKDIPAPVTIQWDGPVSSSSKVVVYTDYELSQIFWTQDVASGKTSTDIYNLIPGRTYYYTLVDGETVLEKGFFETVGRVRMIKVSDTIASGRANNCRDLGGLSTDDGRTIKYGYFYRGTNMDKTTSEEKDLIVNFLNVGLVNELRHGNHNPRNEEYRYNPFEGTLYDVRYVAPGYYWSARDLQIPERMHETMQAFIDAAMAGRATYFHCRIGADRTGYVAFLLLSLLGVSIKDSSIDFELTSFSPGANRTMIRTNSWLYKEALDYLNTKTGATLKEKAENYMVELGISKSDINAFRNIVLE